MKAQGWYAAIAISLGMSGAIVSFPTAAPSQVVADPSIGTIVTPNGTTFQITGGTIAGSRNLFHSFSRFDVPTGGVASFLNSPNIANIFSRVTGGTPSQIDGIVRSAGTANLFLMNPNGIIFGQNARLDVGGSFVATTANAIQFGDQSVFSASTPKASSSLLTIDPSELLFNQTNIAPIQVNSNSIGILPGKSLALIGGNILLDKGILFTSTSLASFNRGANATTNTQIEVGGLREVGIVKLTLDDSNVSFQFSAGVMKSDVSLINGAGILVNVPNGFISINANNLNLLGNSSIINRIGFNILDFLLPPTGLNKLVKQGGNTILNVTKLVMIDNSFILNTVAPDDFPSASSLFEKGGRTGDLIIQTKDLIIKNGAQISNSNFNRGDTRDLIIQGARIQVVGASSDVIPSGVFTWVSNGSAGKLSIHTDNLLIQDGAQVTSDFLSGRGGAINVAASKLVQLSGVNSNGKLTSILSTQGKKAGLSGDITISTENLIVQDGAQVSTSSLPYLRVFNSYTTSAGNGLIISTPIFGGLESGKTSTGFSSLGSSINSSNAGSLNIFASQIELVGSSIDGTVPSGLFSQAESIGNAGNIRVSAERVFVRDGAVVSVSTSSNSQGRGGSLAIDVFDSITLSGTSSIGLPSAFSASTLGIGVAGNSKVSSQNLTIQDGAVVAVSSSNGSRAGSLEINTSNTLELKGASLITGKPSGLFARTFSTGDAGDVKVETQKLSIQDGAQITVNSEGSGRGGNLDIQANSIQLNNWGAIVATSASGDGGNITLQASDLLLLRNDSRISTTAGTAQAGGNGGNININAKFIVAIPKENSDISANAFIGQGGRVQINAQAIFGTQFRPKLTPESDITASSDFGVSGVVSLNTPDNSAIQNSLAQLAQNLIDPNTLLANSCIVRNRQQTGRFYITGSGGLPVRPGDAPLSSFPTGDVRSLPEAGDKEQGTGSRQSWKSGDPIVEPQGIYRLSNGKLVLSRECEQ